MSDNVIGATAVERKFTLYCSFCGKSQHEVLVLIAGPTVFICDECTDLCSSLAAEHRVRKCVREVLAEFGIAPRDSGSGPQGGDAKQAPGEAPQSGGAAASPNPSHSTPGQQP